MYFSLQEAVDNISLSDYAYVIDHIIEVSLDSGVDYHLMSPEKILSRCEEMIEHYSKEYHIDINELKRLTMISIIKYLNHIKEEYYFATYGTLRYGEGNWRNFLQDAKHLKTVRIRGFDMYDSGGFPYCIEGQGSIVVDIFKGHGIHLKDLDRLEGYPNHYNRKEILIENIRCWIYYVSNRKDIQHIKERYPHIRDGDWVKWIRSRPKSTLFDLSDHTNDDYRSNSAFHTMSDEEWEAWKKS